jgi:uncharacterized protein with PhoU and TrkA domain
LLEPGFPAIGQTLVAFDPNHRTGATVIAVVRNGIPPFIPASDFRFIAGDIVVLSGSPNAIQQAVKLISTGNAEDREEELVTSSPSQHIEGARLTWGFLPAQGAKFLLRRAAR